jgi:hypothetical protein
MLTYIVIGTLVVIGAVCHVLGDRHTIHRE